MTLQELLEMPKGLTITEYEKLLKEKQRLEKQIKKLSLSITIVKQKEKLKSL